MKSKLGEDVLIGPLAGARIFGFKTGLTFRRLVPKLPGRIRTVDKLKGTYYILRDVLRAKNQNLDSEAIDALVLDYQEQAAQRKSNTNHRTEYIGPKEAAALFGWRSKNTFIEHLLHLPPIRSKRRGKAKRRYYELESVFAAAFPEASDEMLSVIITDYRQRRAQQRLARWDNETETSESQ